MKIEIIFAISMAVLVAGLIVYILIKKISSKGHAIVNEPEIQLSPEEKTIRDFDKSAGDLIREFHGWMASESPLPRRQRRMIKRHYLKFLYAWVDFPAKKQDIEKIIRYLVSGPHNRNVVQGYLDN